MAAREARSPDGSEGRHVRLVADAGEVGEVRAQRGPKRGVDLIV